MAVTQIWLVLSPYKNSPYLHQGHAFILDVLAALLGFSGIAAVHTLACDILKWVPEGQTLPVPYVQLCDCGASIR